MTKRYSHPSTSAFEPAARARDPHAEEIMRAVVTAGAFVALADGRVDPLERAELLSFIDRLRLVPTISQDEIGRFFDGQVQQIKNQYDAADLAQPLRPLTGKSSASTVVSAAERVAAADLQIHPREVDALNLIRRIMMKPSVRPDTPIPHAPVVELFLFIAALVAFSIGGATIIALTTDQLAHRAATQKSITVTPNNIDNYLELFADGPGRGWYVLGAAQCDVRLGDPPNYLCQQRLTSTPTPPPPPN